LTSLKKKEPFLTYSPALKNDSSPIVAIIMVLAQYHHGKVKDESKTHPFI
jgi:hypothetical protein